jgi:hypothetical protein
MEIGFVAITFPLLLLKELIHSSVRFKPEQLTI